MSSKKLYSVYIIIIVCILIFLGFVFIYSASNYASLKNYNDAFYFVKKQILGFILGIVALIIMYKFDYHKLVKYKYIILGISIIVLLLVFVPFLSVTANGSNRWIGFGPISIQSSEIAKFGFVIYSSCYLSKYYNKMHIFKYCLPVLLSGGCICLLILLEPNLSVTLCVGMVLLFMLFVGGMKLKHLMILLIPALALVPILIIIEPYRFQRLIAFVDPWSNPLEEGYQLIQSLYSLGAGGLFGVGLFNSRQKYMFLPFSESDFIFSIIGEEVGFIGALAIILLYLFLIIFCYKVALKSRDRLGFLLVFGIISLISCQLLINLAVVTGSIPPTGIPLPFISAGGSSLAVLMGGIGIILNVNKTDNTLNEDSNKKHKFRNIFKKSFNPK